MSGTLPAVIHPIDTYYGLCLLISGAQTITLRSLYAAPGATVRFITCGPGSGVNKSVAPGGKKLNGAPTPSSLPFHPFLPLEVGSLNPARGSGGAL